MIKEVTDSRNEIARLKTMCQRLENDSSKYQLQIKLAGEKEESLKAQLKEINEQLNKLKVVYLFYSSEKIESQ